MLPKVLVTGFPRTGTSFVCELIFEMGFNVGPLGQLKKADNLNRWGYWENLTLQRLVRKAVGVDGIKRKNRNAFVWGSPLWDFAPAENAAMAKEISEVANRWKIEVFKDSYLPWARKLFPKTAKCVVVKRNKAYIHGRRGDMEYPDFCKAFRRYYSLAGEMGKGVLTVNYERFGKDFGKETRRIAEHLGVGTLDMKRLELVYRPKR